MFQFRRFPAYDYFIHHTLTEYCSAGFPHSDIHGSLRICRSPWLFAACRVLLRLLMPRHSPCALFRLTFVGADSALLAPSCMTEREERNQRRRRSSEKERKGNALASGAEEGRDKLRKATGSGKYAKIRGYPNGETRQSNTLSAYGE